MPRSPTFNPDLRAQVGLLRHPLAVPQCFTASRAEGGGFDASDAVWVEDKGAPGPCTVSSSCSSCRAQAAVSASDSYASFAMTLPVSVEDKDLPRREDTASAANRGAIVRQLYASFTPKHGAHST